MSKIFQIMAWILIVAILLLSLVPPMLRPNTDIPHNVEHFTIFLLTGFAFGIGYPRRYLLQSIALVVFALSIEISQLWALGRHARLSDFVVDALAACIGIGAIERVRQPDQAASEPVSFPDSGHTSANGIHHRHPYNRSP